MNGYLPPKQKIINFINDFKKEEGHYPSVTEFNESPFSPCSTKTIQRHYGGFIKIKKEMGIEDYDLRKKVASYHSAQHYDTNTDLNNFLFSKFKVIINEEHNENTRNKSKYGIYSQNYHFFIENFFTTSINNTMNCINQRIKKIKDSTKEDVYLVLMNEELDKKTIYKNIKFKKNPIPSNIKFMFMSEFIKYCETLKPVV